MALGTAVQPFLEEAITMSPESQSDCAYRYSPHSYCACSQMLDPAKSQTFHPPPSGKPSEAGAKEQRSVGLRDSFHVVRYISYEET